jgi:UDP-N-acetyl-D-glucosamine dehydrogenase
LVTGIDIDSERVDNLSMAISPNESISDIELKEIVNLNQFLPTTDFSLLSDIDTVIIAVPTPLCRDKTPDHEPLRTVCSIIAEELKHDALLINESTSYPGTLRDLIAPIIASKRSDFANEISFACSPERVNPGDSLFSHSNIPRVVSGLDELAKTKVTQFYKDFVKEVFVASTPEVAEMSKLLENSFRMVNISFINEISDYCASKEIPVREVIAAASTKPFGYMPFYPGPGVGGHCIPVDPVYLVENAHQDRIALPILENALSFNENRYQTIVSLVDKEVNGLSKKNILIEGITYKPNVRDMRETPATNILEGLKKAGAQVSWHDPLIDSWNGTNSTSLNAENWDAIVVLVLHDATDVSELVKNSKKIIDFTGRIHEFGEVIQSR